MNDDKRKTFILFFAVGIVTVTLVYAFCITFIPIPDSGKDHAKTILGFLLATGLATLISYYWGSSSGSAAKSDTIDKVLQGPAPVPPPVHDPEVRQ
jgi:hypothetical protein